MLRDSIQPYLGSSDVCKLNGPDDADIDADTLALLIDEGHFSESDFVAYCDSFGLPSRRPDGDFHHDAAQSFLDAKRGQEVMSLALPTDDSAVVVYAAIVDFVRRNNFRLWCPMPDVQGDIDLDDPGRLPPHWDRYVS
jgi:hypothetical protein